MRETSLTWHCARFDGKWNFTYFIKNYHVGSGGHVDWCGFTCRPHWPVGEVWCRWHPAIQAECWSQHHTGAAQEIQTWRQHWRHWWVHVCLLHVKYSHWWVHMSPTVSLGYMLPVLGGAFKGANTMMSLLSYTLYLNCSTFNYLYFIFYFNRVRNNVTQNIVNKWNGKFF